MGDEVTRGSTGGETHGTVETIVTSTTEIEGRAAGATENPLQVVVRSEKSGKKAVHRSRRLKKA